MRPCVNLIMGLVEGWDLYTIIQAAQENACKLRRGGDRLLELKACLWRFSMHLAYGPGSDLAWCAQGREEPPGH